MKFTSLDKITRSMLLQKQLPLHYYVQFLKYSSDCVRELTFDSLQVINTIELSINQADFTANLPCDCVDWIKIGVPRGQFVQPLVQRDSINRLTKFTPQGQPTTYGSPVPVDFTFPYWPGYWMFQNIDDLGENTGRLYGNTGNTNHTFKVIPERGQIQFSEQICSQVAVLEYVSDGQTVGSETRVDPLCQACVEAYDDWKYKLHSKRSGPGEVEQAFRLYKIEVRRFRARKNQMTPWDIRQVLYNNYIQAPKN